MCIRDRISVSSSGDDTRGTDISKSQGDGDSTAEAGIRCSSNECSMLTWDNVGIGATDLPSLGADGARGAESPLSGAIRGRGTSEYPPNTRQNEMRLLCLFATQEAIVVCTTLGRR